MIKYSKYVFLAILALGFLVRLYKIDNPVADWHSWRQADTSAVTRNYVKEGINLLFPKYDDMSDVSGRGLLNKETYRFVEFPAFNLIHFALVKLFPIQTLEFWGRMTSVIASLFSAIFIFFITKRHTSLNTGLLAMFFFLMLPYNIYFSRVILPDPLMVTLYLASLNFFDLWARGMSQKFLLLSGFFGGLAVMVKPAAIFFLLPITYTLFRKLGLRFFKSKLFWALNLSFVIPFLIWRTWEYRFPQGVPASAWLLNGDHIRFKGAFFQWIFGERISQIILGGWGTLLLGIGAVESGFFFPWLISALLYLFTFATGNVRHDYYQIPIIPIVSILLAVGTTYLLKPDRTFARTAGRRILVIVCIAFSLAFSWYRIRGNYQVNHWEIVHAGRRVDQIVPKDAVVIAPYNGDTAFLYQTNRKGFAYVPFPIKDLIDRFDARYFVSVNYDDATRAVMAKYTVIEQNPSFVIVELIEPKLLP